MIASLPMYDWPELAHSTNSLWQLIRDRLRSAKIDAPESLARSTDDETFWLAPDLLLAQTCGYPLSTKLRGKVGYVATPCYAVEGCNGPYYSSAIIAASDSGLTMDGLAGTRFAYNSSMSLSGYRCIRAMVGEPQDYFSATIISGGHRNSARMVASGEADIAALDAVCWHLLQRFEPQTAAKLKVIGWSELRPALSFITSLETNEKSLAVLRQVLCDVLSTAMQNPTIEPLAISGCKVLNIAEYYQLSEL